MVDDMLDVDGMLRGKIPAPVYRPQVLSFSIVEILGSSRRRAEYSKHESFDGEWLFGFKIPPFQRPLCWTQEQKLRFLESVWSGYSIGSYTVNKLEWRGNSIPEYDGYLIDGRQRITTIREYVVDESLTPFGYRWSELDDIDRCRFENVMFPQHRVNIADYESLLRLYDRLNYGGTPHRQEDRIPYVK